MATQQYFSERCLQFINCKLVHNVAKHYFGTTNTHVTFGGNKYKTMLFLHVKTLNLQKMLFPYIPNCETYPSFCVFNYDTKEVVTTFNFSQPTLPDFNVFSESVTDYVTYFNNIITKFVDEKLNNTYYGTIIYPEFSIAARNITCTYKNKNNDNAYYTNNQTYYVSFNKFIVENIAKYFDLGTILHGNKCFYYIIANNTTAHKNTSDFFTPKWNLNIETNDRQVDKIVYTFDTDKECVNIDKYFLLAIQDDGNIAIDFKFTVDIPLDADYINDIEMKIDGDVIITSDSLTTLDYFNTYVGRIYSEKEYHDMFYRKYVGIITKYSFNHEAFPTDKLEKILAILEAHLEIPADKKNSLTNILLAIYDAASKDQQDDGTANILKEIYSLLCHTQSIENIGPPANKLAKIEF